MNGYKALPSSTMPLTMMFFVIVAIVRGDLLGRHTRGTGNVYHGRYTRNVHEPELMIPRRVLADGTFDTYTLPNFYDRREIDDRRKRSIDPGEHRPDADKLHLVLPFNGIDHHVELSPYHEFISPDMVIETRGAGLRENLNEAVRFKRAPDQQCHYRGFVRGHESSRAALSLCDGVVGYVQTDHGRYFVEPAHDAEPGPDGQHVHIAYARETPEERKRKDDEAGRQCATSDNWENAWAEQLAERQRKLMLGHPEETKRDATISSATHSVHRYIEIGLVADRRFLDFYNNTNYEQYLLTIMNMVADFYHDASVGNQIDVVLVRMIYLEKEKEEIDLLISPAAEETLASFAKWAARMNPKDVTHPNHFDIAALVTRYDICSEGTNCDLMGLAYVATACNPDKAAAINEDSGLLLGIVVAHEVGHVMGCSHDEESISGCPPQDKDGSYFLMSPIVFIYTIRWSSCSRRFITNLLESGLGECLNNDPRNPPEKLKYPNMLPGAMYDANFQCDMTFPGSKQCPTKTKLCEQLWCKLDKGCSSRGAPMAEGTKCGENKWCIQKKCVDMGSRPSAVNGGWGKWGPMSSCSRSCGGGLQKAERECDNPPPANGGRYCIGERKKINVCNTTPCDPKMPSYRATQCSSYDQQEILSDGLHKWEPYYAPELEPCVLFCINEQQTYIQLQSTANDSTPCQPGTNNMCIGGTCRKVGCDWVLESTAIDDKCGICKGDGTKCKVVEGTFTATKTGHRYEKIVTIPKDARSIYVAEDKSDTNTLAVRLEKSNTYCINGNLTEERSGDYECAKAILVYMHLEPDKEEIKIKGPIMEDIRIEYVFYKAANNPGIHYSYYVMAESSYKPKYMWDFTEWSQCSAKCGSGTMMSEPTCVEEQAGKVSPSYCDEKMRPETKSRVCNTQPCPAKWRVSQWSQCSACNGKKGARHRKVQCVKPAAKPGEDDVQANLDACQGRVPKQSEECVGTRPCRKTCSPSGDRGKTRKSVPVREQGKLIDKFVDLSLARYLEKTYGIPRGDTDIASEVDSPDFRQLLRDWSVVGEEKRKRGACQSNVTTPQPGSIVKDKVPLKNIVLMQAPLLEEQLQSNLSDRAYQESGDEVGSSLDTSRLKIYNGTAAIEMMEKLGGRNKTSAERKPTGESNYAFDGLSKIVDAADE